jgi:protein phosphatase
MFVSPDTTALTIQPGDLLILCSDGLHDQTPAAVLASIASQNRPLDEIAAELVAHALEIDGNDNTSAQIIRIRSVEQAGIYRGRPCHVQS